jgi:lysophospholipid acyltransferase (LPLAT)-like uncharacterized protein
MEIINPEVLNRLRSKNQNFVIAFWHGKMVIGWYLFRNQNFTALISQSKDGQILTKVLEKWNYNVVRGSSHKGGKESLEILIEKAYMDYSIAITPDGPTGPKNVMKPGAVIIAKKTGIPLILLGAKLKRRIIFNSWDKFQLPKPFSKVYIKFSNPYYIDPDLDYESTNELITEMSKQLNSLNEELERMC